MERLLAALQRLGGEVTKTLLKPASAGELRRLIPPPRESGYTPSFDGTQIYWELHGPAPSESDRTPLVFCYGLVCAMNHWRHQLERYHKTHPCLLIDYRGHHRSAFPVNARLMNMSAIARDVAAVMRERDFKRPAHIWGHSYGCNIALELALADPALCRSLVLIAGSCDNPFATMFNGKYADKVTTPLFDAYKDFPAAFLTAWELLQKQPKLIEIISQAAGFNRDASETEDVRAYAEGVAAVEPRTFWPLVIEYSKGMTRGILPKIETPALVIAGAKDHVTPPGNQKKLAEGLKKSTFLEIKAGSHCVHVDFAEYLGMKVEEWWHAHSLE